MITEPKLTSALIVKSKRPCNPSTVITSYSIHYTKLYDVQCDELPEVRLMNEAEKAPFLKALEQRCAIIAHPEQVLEHWNSFTRNRLASYFSKTYGYGRIRRKLMKMGILKPDFNRNLRYLQLLNCLRSEVHREAFLDAIKNNLK